MLGCFDSFFWAVVGFNWVFPSSVRQNLLSCQGAPVGKKRKKIFRWQSLSVYSELSGWKGTWLLLRMKFPSIQRMKVSFLTNLRSWANLYSVDNTNSLIDFFCLGWGEGEYKRFL